MVWLMILLLFLLLILWLLLSPVSCVIDTRVPVASIQWAVVSAGITYSNDEWKLSYSILFYKKELSLPLKRKAQQPEKKHKKQGAKRATAPSITKILRVIKTIRIKQWQIAVDTGDWILNSWLYPVNYMRHTGKHVRVNYTGDSYVVLRLTCTPLRALYAWLRG